MAKGPLQTRAEEALRRFRERARAPIVIEFAGLPKAGKTTTLAQIQAFFKRCGFRTEVVIERASVCPIKDKKHFNFNVWTACTSLTQILEKTQVPQRPDDPDILILDRGIFDAACWLDVMEGLARVRRADRELIERFLLSEDWRSRITGVVLMMSNPEQSLEREKGQLPVEQGVGGSIMNSEVLRQMRRVLENAAARLHAQFRIFSVDTSAKEYNNNARQTCEAVAAKILDWIEDELEEHVLAIEKSLLKSMVATSVVSKTDTANLVQAFEKRGEFIPRTTVEADTTRVQALPVVVVRNKSGKILELIRKEKDPKNPLHEKLVIWAGGHVRREDGLGGRSAVLWGALREIQEELRLCIEPEGLQLRGAIYVDKTAKSARHIAIVYEWSAPSEDVEIALCNSEFFERRGNSLRGNFIPEKDIVAQGKAGELEDWSALIAEHMLQPA